MTQANNFSAQSLQAAIDSKTKPVGSLGRIEALAHQAGMLQQSHTPCMKKCQLLIFAADHGIAETGVSAFPSAVTRQMVLNFLHRGAAANAFADVVGAKLCVVDAGVAGEPIEHAELLQRRISAATANSVVGPAMTPAQRTLAIESGRTLVAEFAVDAFCFGEMGIGNTSAATLLAHKLLDIPLNQLVGRGTGLDDDGLQRKRSILAEAAQRTPDELGVDTALAEYGGFEIAMMAGAMLGAAANKKMIIVDGFIATVAAAVALKYEPAIADALVYSHVSAESGHRYVLQALDAQPLFDLGLRLGEGTGALLAWPMLKAAGAMLTTMASFDSAGVSGRSS